MTETAEKLVTYAVLIEAREMRTAFGFTLADAIDEARGATPKDCLITVQYSDGLELSLDPDFLSRPTIPADQMRKRLIAIAHKGLRKLSNPCPPGMVSTKKIWEKWIAEGPTEDHIRGHQNMSAEWLPRPEIEAYEREHIPK